MINIRNIDEKHFCMLIGYAMLISGIMLFVYTFLLNIPILMISLTSNPLFYLINGFSLVLVSKFIDYTDKLEAEK